MKVRNFRDLKVWKLGKEIVVDVYRKTQRFPLDERYGLVAQIRRAAVSIPSNIAEGFNKYNRNEFRRYLFISLGSCAELETQIELSHDLGYLGKDIADEIVARVNVEEKMIANLIKSQRNSQNYNFPSTGY